MLLNGNEGTEFELKVIGYQFPDLEKEEYDSDWLSIQLRVVHPRGSWSSIDPPLLTWEVSSLAEWLESISRGERVDEEESFLEPNFSFQLTGNGTKKLRVYFELESRPEWAPYDGSSMEDLWLEFELDPVQLRDAAASLREALQRYPVRVGFRANV
ncbi:MAG: hypothetical protein QOJ64_733 [Acidobacteriota bacterium]|jgi:hypothetical protein|nr:hypothetical protein [Acidobacteriota bacterium]